MGLGRAETQADRCSPQARDFGAETQTDVVDQLAFDVLRSSRPVTENELPTMNAAPTSTAAAAGPPSLFNVSLTVLLAVYNGQKYLRESLDSVLAQTFGDFEFLIIDDGSTDQTLSILKQYQARDTRIRLVSRPNRGLTNTLNEGLSLARGEFLARMDADDLCLPQRFEKQLAYLRAHPECVLVGSRVEVMDPEGMPIRLMCDEVTHEQIDAAHMNRQWPVVHPAVMMRLSAAQRLGYRDIYNTLEDLDLFLRLAEIGKLANLPDVLLRYRQHFASVTHSREAEQMKVREAIYREARTRRGLPPEPEPVATRVRPRKAFEQHRYWAWSALKAGNVATARKHAVKTLFRSPLDINSWRLLACAVRGY
jgi:GT2 family glycosyltransferase